MHPLYQITFPRQPIEDVIARMKAAGMTYVRPNSTGPDPSGLGGYWEGRLAAEVLTTLALPNGVTIKQYEGK